MIKLKKFKNVGIVGFGAYVPSLRLKTKKVAEAWNKNAGQVEKSLGIKQKSVAASDEDAVTMAVEASQIALKRASLNPKKIGAIFVGSESHPYAVKPSGTIVAQVLGMSHSYFCSDLEFACKAATTGLQIVASMLEAGLIDYGLVVGTDKAQARPGDVLEYTAAAGAAAFILGNKKNEFLAELEYVYSFNSDTPDFWRREGESYPQHAGRFTGEPGYFYHTKNCLKAFLKKTQQKTDDFDQVVFHMPNVKFPKKLARAVGFSYEQLKTGFVVQEIGNTYSACSLLGLCLVLEKIKPRKKVLLVSYGSGAGSDSLSFKTKPALLAKRETGICLADLINQTREISYTSYLKSIGAIQ